MRFLCWDQHLRISTHQRQPFFLQKSLCFPGQHLKSVAILFWPHVDKQLHGSRHSVKCKFRGPVVVFFKSIQFHSHEANSIFMTSIVCRKKHSSWVKVGIRYSILLNQVIYTVGVWFLKKMIIVFSKKAQIWFLKY